MKKLYLEQSGKLCGNRKCLDLISPSSTMQYDLFPVHAGIQSNASFIKLKKAIKGKSHEYKRSNRVMSNGSCSLFR